MINYTFNPNFSYIPKEELITVSNCLDYTLSIKEQNIMLMVIIFILILYILIPSIKTLLRK